MKVYDKINDKLDGDFLDQGKKVNNQFDMSKLDAIKEKSSKNFFDKMNDLKSKKTHKKKDEMDDLLDMGGKEEINQTQDTDLLDFDVTTPVKESKPKQTNTGMDFDLLGSGKKSEEKKPASNDLLFDFDNGMKLDTKKVETKPEVKQSQVKKDDPFDFIAF